MSWITKLLDTVGRRSASPTQTSGVGATVFNHGFLYSSEKNPKLVGEQKWLTYDDLMLNYSIVAAGVRYFLNRVAQPAWKVNPADDTPAAQAVAELVDRSMSDMRTPWYRVVRKAALFRFHGFGFQEWTAKTNKDGTITMLDVAARPATTLARWDIDDTGAILGVTQRNPNNGVEIYLNRAKLIYCVDDSLTDHPEGIGLLRHVVDAAARLRHYEVLEHTGFVTDLRGVPVARIPYVWLRQQVKAGAMTQAQATSMIDTMTKFVSNHIKSVHSGMAMDSAVITDQGPTTAPTSTPRWDFQLIQGGPTSAEAVGAAINRLTYDIARIIGCEHLLLGSDGTGSLALSKTKSTDFALAVDSTLTEVAEVMNSDFVTPICDLNGVPEELRPEMRTEALHLQEIGDVTQALSELAMSGAPLAPDDPAINEIRDMLGLSDRPEQAAIDEMNAASLRGQTIAATPPPDPADAGKPGDKPAEGEQVTGEGDKSPKGGTIKKRRTRLKK